VDIDADCIITGSLTCQRLRIAEMGSLCVGGSVVAQYVHADESHVLIGENMDADLVWQIGDSGQLTVRKTLRSRAVIGVTSAGRGVAKKVFRVSFTQGVRTHVSGRSVRQRRYFSAGGVDTLPAEEDAHLNHPRSVPAPPSLGTPCGTWIECIRWGVPSRDKRLSSVERVGHDGSQLGLEVERNADLPHGVEHIGWLAFQ
jgi:hypothetical protein